MNNRFLRLKKALRAVLLVLLLCTTGMMGMYAQRPNQNSTNRDVPEGAINGLFSVAPGYQVFFSQGNLQYQASSNTWRFATNQYDLIHTVDEMVHYDEELEAYYCDVANEYSSTYAGWIDMFGWGTSGYNHGAVCYQPWDISINEDDYNVYGSETYNLCVFLK